MSLRNILDQHERRERRLIRIGIAVVVGIAGFAGWAVSEWIGLWAGVALAILCLVVFCCYYFKQPAPPK